jgi:hypothetical protein
MNARRVQEFNDRFGKGIVHKLGLPPIFSGFINLRGFTFHSSVADGAGRNFGLKAGFERMGMRRKILGLYRFDDGAILKGKWSILNRNPNSCVENIASLTHCPRKSGGIVVLLQSPRGRTQWPI